MLSVACLLARPDDTRILASHLRPRATVHPFDDRRALVGHVRSIGVAAVVVDLRDGEGRPISGTVRALRAVAPRLPVLARCRLAAPDCRALLDFARAGGTDVVVEDRYEPLLAALRVERVASGPAHEAIVGRLLAAGVPEGFSPLLEHLFAHLDEPDAARSAAERLGVSQRALERRLARAALPPPRTLHSWCRLLAAADRLEGDALAVERIALGVGFSSANALRNALQRYGGTTPSAVRTDGGLEALIGRLCRHDASPRQRVAEGTSANPGDTCALAGALGMRQRLLARLTTALAGVGAREGCRTRCAPRTRGGRILPPRSRRGNSASAGGRTSGGIAHEGRITC